MSGKKKMDIQELGLTKEQRQAGSISFDTKRQDELKKLWTDSLKLQNQLYSARTSYYDKKLGGDTDAQNFQKELQNILRDIRQKLNRSIARVLRETNEMRNEVIRNDKMLEEQDRLILEATMKIQKLKDNIKQQKKELINKKVINELYHKQPAFTNEYIFHIALTAISIVIFFFIINK
jgi:hypothetical protein